MEEMTVSVPLWGFLISNTANGAEVIDDTLFPSPYGVS